MIFKVAEVQGVWIMCSFQFIFMDIKDRIGALVIIFAVITVEMGVDDDVNGFRR